MIILGLGFLRLTIHTTTSGLVKLNIGSYDRRKFTKVIFTSLLVSLLQLHQLELQYLPPSTPNPTSPPKHVFSIKTTIAVYVLHVLHNLLHTFGAEAHIHSYVIFNNIKNSSPKAQLSRKLLLDSILETLILIRRHEF